MSNCSTSYRYVNRLWIVWHFNMEALIQTISFEIELRNSANKGFRYESRKFGVQKRLELGVYETTDSRDSIFTFNMQEISIDTLEKLLSVLAQRHKSQCDWIRICNEMVYSRCQKNMPHDVYSDFIRKQIAEKNLNGKKVLSKRDAVCVAISKTYEKYKLKKKEFSLFYLVIKAEIDENTTQSEVLELIGRCNIPEEAMPSLSSLKQLTTNKDYPEWKIEGISLSDMERYNDIAKTFLDEYNSLINGK